MSDAKILGVATTPPMGWNSWDCFGGSVTEDEVLQNARYLHENLLAAGWEYVVVDISWFSQDITGSQYPRFSKIALDDYGRPQPDPTRFPHGFTWLGEQIHALGLKFGLHLMRGMPRLSAHGRYPIFGTDGLTADQVADPYSVCPWNPDMYGLDVNKPGAQAWYDAFYQQLAEWGVDYVKLDDALSPKFHAAEIEMARIAIARSGRPMVLSLSPGEAPLDHADTLKANAHLWRISGDFWDRWDDLLHNFSLCAAWTPHTAPDRWPDADMLPIGRIGIRSTDGGAGDRWTRFTKDEQFTLITLWSMARSPLMVGCHLPDCDAWTLDLLTNTDVLAIGKTATRSHQVYRRDPAVVWMAQAGETVWIALFNVGDEIATIAVTWSELGISGRYRARELWTGNERPIVDGAIFAGVPSHGVRLYRLDR